MSMPLHDALAAVRRVAPERLAESWDKVGLHVGSSAKNLKAALLCIDLTEAVVEEAAAAKAGLIVAYHPPIFKPLTSLTGSTWKERALLAAVRKNIAVYSPHTALDAVRGGMNDWLCEGLGQGSTQPISVHQPKRDEYKVVVFVPVDAADRVREAMSAAGAGCIGNYRECSFQTAGTGGFRPLSGAQPAIGKVGRRETVAELRLEMLCEGSRLGDVAAAIHEAHPYEEPAFDVFREAALPADPASATGSGRLLRLKKPIAAAALAGRVKKRLQMPKVKLAEPVGGGTIQTVAVCVGAGGSLFEDCNADAYVTGEMQHHQALELQQAGKAVVLAGHTNTERPFLPAYCELLRAAGAERVDWRVSQADRAPFVLR